MMASIVCVKTRSMSSLEILQCLKSSWRGIRTISYGITGATTYLEGRWTAEMPNVVVGDSTDRPQIQIHRCPSSVVRDACCPKTRCSRVPLLGHRLQTNLTLANAVLQEACKHVKQDLSMF